MLLSNYVIVLEGIIGMCWSDRFKYIFAFSIIVVAQILKYGFRIVAEQGVRARARGRDWGRLEPAGHVGARTSLPAFKKKKKKIWF